MPTTMQATRIQPKRKRAEVVYYESDTDESDAKASDASSVDHVISAKKVKRNNGKAVSTKPLPKKKLFPFVRLPAEIKNQIYDLALRDENGIFLILKTKAYRRTIQRSTPDSNDASGGSRRRRQRYAAYLTEQAKSDKDVAPPAALVPNILLLNREIFAETQPILYGGNAFAVEDTTALHSFLANIGSKNCATLTDLTIKGWGYTKAHKAMNYPAFTMLGRAVNLESLYIDCRIHWDGPKGVARQIYRDGHHYFEAIGAAKGKFDAAIDTLDFLPENFEMCRYHMYGRPAPKELTTNERVNEFRAELRKLLRSH